MFEKFSKNYYPESQISSNKKHIGISDEAMFIKKKDKNRFSINHDSSPDRNEKIQFEILVNPKTKFDQSKSPAGTKDLVLTQKEKIEIERRDKICSDLLNNTRLMQLFKKDIHTPRNINECLERIQTYSAKLELK